MGNLQSDPTGSKITRAMILKSSHSRAAEPLETLEYPVLQANQNCEKILPDFSHNAPVRVAKNEKKIKNKEL